METYDPLNGPDQREWNALDEDEHIMLVEQFHEDSNIQLPNLHLLSLIHVIVENQVAMGDQYIALKALERLMSEGLDRHDAIHAIGSVLTEYFHTTLQEKGGSSYSEEYDSSLNALTAEKWRQLEE